MNPRNVSLIALLLFLSAATTFADSRTWTSADGKTIEGTILDFDGENVKLETERGVFDLPLSRLSEEDQEFAKTWSKEKEEMAEAESEESGRPQASQIGNFEDLTLGEWPQYVTADLDLDDIVIVEGEELSALREENEGGQGGEELYVYRTPHFEFHAPDRLSASVIRDFSRIFEATFQFIDQMPIGLAPSPSSNGFYPTKLYMTRDDYYADGGMTGSGGMMSWRRRGNEMSSLIQVPLPNLGVEYTGTRFIVDGNKRSTTLTHEIAHQVMMLWLMTPMPTWFSEGVAEVVSCQDYDNGRFKLSSMDRAVVEDVTRGQGRDFTMLDLDSLMNISSRQWSADLASGRGGLNYNSANVLAYYFLKLDGEGDAANLVEFLKELPTIKRGDSEGLDALQEKHLRRGRSYAELQEEVAKAWRSEGLQIEFLPSRSE
ncbi:MAG: hypothetical protein AAGF67_05425 [Verrucomicrobiota bacterium]